MSRPGVRGVARPTRPRVPDSSLSRGRDGSSGSPGLVGAEVLGLTSRTEEMSENEPTLWTRPETDPCGRCDSEEGSRVLRWTSSPTFRIGPRTTLSPSPFWGTSSLTQRGDEVRGTAGVRPVGLRVSG